MTEITRETELEQVRQAVAHNRDLRVISVSQDGLVHYEFYSLSTIEPLFMRKDKFLREFGNAA